MSEPTPQQLAAITKRGHSVVLSSGAGCGKTFVLTNRYLSHLRNDRVGVGQIVAITFTDRAARQMRDRIRKAVTEELRGDPNDTGWADHLRGLETAPIQTIHSFCGNLLRQYAVEAGLDSRFEVLEEILADNLRADALRDTLQTLLTGDSEAGNDLCELVVLYGWHSTVTAVRAMLFEHNMIAWQDWLLRSPADIATEWVATTRQTLLPLWIDYLISAAPKIAHLVNLFNSIECRGPEMKANLEKVLAGLPRLAAANDLATAIKELTEAAKVGKEKAAAWPDDETYEIVKKAMGEFRKDLPEKLALFMEEPGDLEAAAVVGQRFVRVAMAVTQAYQQRKARAAVLDFQDLLVMARDLVRDNQDVRKSLQARYRYLLIDEMQDTDPIQMELVELLCGVGIEHDKLFAVGDAKQSIYRFRGAEVDLFHGLRENLGAQGRLSLTRNYRSQPAILQFVNALCSLRLPDYEPLEAHREQAYAGPCVEFLWSVPAESTDKEPASAVRAREADAIARRIVELVSLAEPRLLDQGVLRKVEPGDIVLLFRSMNNVAIYETALRQHGLNYYLVGGRAFFAQQEIYDLLNLLRALENPDDGIALAGTLRSPFGCLSDDALVLLGLHEHGLWAGLHDSATVSRLSDEQRPRAERIRTLLDDWRTRKDRLPIARLIGRVVADTGYDAALQFEFLGDRKLANLWKLINLAREFDRSGLFGLADFIARLGELVTNQPREEQAATQPEEANVIRIMSIHQAKGLEFPVVFVPDLAAAGRGGHFPAARWDRRLGCLAKPPDEDPPLFTDFPHRLGLAWGTVAEWREELRVLYVACTRAADLLILSAGLKEPFPTNAKLDQSANIKAPNAWMLALGERFHLLTGECRAPSIPEESPPQIRVSIVALDDGVPAIPLRADGMAAPDFSVADIAAQLPSPWPAIVSLSELEPQAWSDSESRDFRRALETWDLRSAPAQSELLACFAASKWPGTLRAAKRLFRDVEFLSPWPGNSASDRPAIRGTIDFLWQDAGGWHVLMLDAGKSRLAAGGTLCAWVVNEQFGSPPTSVSVFDLRSGATIDLPLPSGYAASWRELDETLDRIRQTG